MRKKDYQKPTTMVVPLKQQCHILAGSAKDGHTGVQNYDWNDEIEE